MCVTLQSLAPQVTLEELFRGTTKRLRITRHILDGASGKQVAVQEELAVEIRPGWKDGTKVGACVFAGAWVSVWDMLHEELHSEGVGQGDTAASAERTASGWVRMG